MTDPRVEIALRAEEITRLRADLARLRQLGDALADAAGKASGQITSQRTDPLGTSLWRLDEALAAWREGRP